MKAYTIGFDVLNTVFTQIREVDLLGRASTSVGYCHIDKGCKYAITNMHGNNGIARSSNGTFYVANCIRGGLNVLEERENNRLEVVDFVPAGKIFLALIFDTLLYS